MRKILGGAIIGTGFAFGLFLAVYVMLYCGIMQAVNNWGVDNSLVVFGIIRAAVSELGMVPGYLICALGVFVWD